MAALCFELPMMRSDLPLGRSCSRSTIGASGSIAVPAAVIAVGWLGTIGGAAVVVGAGGLSDASAGLSDRTPAAAGSVVMVPGLSCSAGVAATAGEDTAGCSELDVGVDTGVATTAGEDSTTDWPGLELADATDVGATAGVALTTGCSVSGVASSGEEFTTGWFAFVVAVGFGVCIPSAAASVTALSVFPLGAGSGTSAGVRPPVCSLGSTVVFRPIDSPPLSLTAGTAPLNGRGVVSGSEPAGFSVVSLKPASGGGPPVSTLDSGLSASATGSANAAQVLTRSKINQVQVKSRSKR